MTTALEALAFSLASLRAEAIAGPMREKLALHVVDATGAWIAASHTAEGRALIAFRGTVQTAGGEPSLFADVATSCALARSSEIDDIHLASMTTPGSIVVPGALTIARALPDMNPSDLTPALIAGYEAMIRLGLAIGGPNILYRGIWPTYVAAPFAIAAVASRLMKLDARATSHALALALTLAAPGVGHHSAETTARWLAVGNAARNGLAAAFAARSGFTSDLKMLQSGFFANVYGITPDLSPLTGGLDAEPMLAQVSCKPWCAARQTIAATQALREVIDDGVKPGDIAEIRVAVLPPHLKMIDHGVVAGDRASHLTSVQYQMAVAALEPKAALELSSSSPSPEIQAFMARIRVEPDEALLTAYPSAWPARIAVATRSGTHERLVTHVPGDPARPFAAQDISTKFHRVVAPLIGTHRADGVLRRIGEALEQPRALTALVDDVNRIGERALFGSPS